MTGAYAQRLPSIAAQDGARTEIIVVDPVIVLPAFLRIQPYGQRDADISFAGKIVMIETILFPVNTYPVIGFEALRVVVVVDHAFRNPAVVAEVAFVLAKRDDLADGSITILKDQSLYDQVFPGHPQVGLPFQGNFSFFLYAQSDRRLGRSFAFEQ